MSDSSMVEQKINTADNPIKSSTLKSIFSICLFALWVLVMFPVLLYYRFFLPQRTDEFYLRFHRGVCRIFSMRVKKIGDTHRDKPVLFVANHISYLDIMALGAYTPTFFIAKSEVGNWPIFGALAKLQNTLFFERKGSQVRKQLDVMAKHFNEGNNLLLFAEGTSTEGEHVEPFKSSLFQAIEKSHKRVAIQPVTIAYTRYKNQKMDRVTRDNFAWYGTTPFFSHFFSAAGTGIVDIQLIFHTSVYLDDFPSRKACANYCEEQVRSALSSALNL